MFLFEARGFLFAARRFIYARRVAEENKLENKYDRKNPAANIIFN